jgi:hypothetical protein
MDWLEMTLKHVNHSATGAIQLWRQNGKCLANSEQFQIKWTIRCGAAFCEGQANIRGGGCIESQERASIKPENVRQDVIVHPSDYSKFKTQSGVGSGATRAHLPLAPSLWAKHRVNGDWWVSLDAARQGLSDSPTTALIGASMPKLYPIKWLYLVLS